MKKIVLTLSSLFFLNFAAYSMDEVKKQLRAIAHTALNKNPQAAKDAIENKFLKEKYESYECYSFSVNGLTDTDTFFYTAKKENEETKLVFEYNSQTKQAKRITYSDENSPE